MSSLQKHTINNQAVWSGHIRRYNGQSTNTPVRFIIRPLNTNDAEAMGNLSANIYSHLHLGEECFIHKHQKEYYHQIFNRTDTQYIGIFVGTNLIGMSYFRICRDEQTFADEIPNSPINFFRRRPQAKIAAFGADCVNPEYRGNNLNQIMIAYRLEQASLLGCTDAASIIDRCNHWNMPPYFNNGFQMFATAIDPSDNGKIALMHHNLNSKQSRPHQNGISIPYNRFNIIDNLINKGFVGVSYQKEHASILFVPTSRTTKMLQNNIISIITKGIQHV